MSDSELSDCSRSSSPAPVLQQQTQARVKADKSTGASRDSKRKQRSDSECSIGSRSSSPAAPQKKKKARKSSGSKDKGKKSGSRPEWEQERRAYSPTPVPPATAPPTSKKESKASGSSASKRKSSSSALKKSGGIDIFKIIREEEKLTHNSSKSTSTTSTFTSRVSSGQSRRSTINAGDYFVDLKVYKIEDWQGSTGLERYKKSLATVKLQCDEKSVQWESIQQFLGQAFTIFQDSEPVHYSEVRK